MFTTALTFLFLVNCFSRAISLLYERNVFLLTSIFSCRTISEAFDLNSNYWIGLSDQASEHTYRWVNGNIANADDDSLWYPGYPTSSNYGSYDCCTAYLHIDYSYAFLAWDTPCATHYYSICEKLVETHF